jgi:uncharacterized membrane protein YraQ (UPF0718 family)
MLISTIIMGALAVVLTYFAYRKDVHPQGFKIGWDLLIQILPMLFFVFVVTGMTQVLIPKEAISKWIGAESGFRGLLIGSVIGGLTPGGPYNAFPIAAGLLKMGGSVGTVVAFLTGWLLIAVSRLPLEIGLMGWKFSLIRIACTFFFPPIAGYIANVFFAKANVV